MILEGVEEGGRYKDVKKWVLGLTQPQKPRQEKSVAQDHIREDNNPFFLPIWIHPPPPQKKHKD